jgi:hypothetical protein
MVLKIAFPDDFRFSLDNDKKDNDSEIKTITEIIIRINTTYFILFTSFSRFRDMKKATLSPVKTNPNIK